MRALLVDDDQELARLLRDYLSTHGVALEHAGDGSAALARLAAGPLPDIVLLDVMLPGIDGFEVCRRLRAAHDVPVVMLTARGDDSDRVAGLDLGADDYVPKPFNPRELLARMRAVLRRARPRPAPAPSAIAVRADRVEVGDLVVDAAAQRATVGGAELDLTSFELRVLFELARRAGETVTREELAVAVLVKAAGYDPSVDRSLDVHVSHLRQKLGPTGPKRIRTVRGVGYVLVRP
jgi:DNA-binding response OmpR family regulator